MCHVLMAKVAVFCVNLLAILITQKTTSKFEYLYQFS